MNELIMLLNDYHIYPWLGPGSGLLCFIFFIIILGQRSRNKRNVIKLELSNRLLKHIQPSAGLENNLNLMLETLGSLVNAPAYTFYIMDEKKKQFVLKAIRHREGMIGRAAPSYSGLVTGGKEIYHPPLQLQENNRPDKIRIIKEGEVPLLVVPLEGGKGLIRIGPISKLSTKQKRMLDYSSGIIFRMLNILTEGEQIKQDAELVVTSGQALHHISSMALDSTATMNKMLSMAAVALELDAGCLIVPNGMMYTTNIRFGLSKQADEELNRQLTSYSGVFQWLGERNSAVIRSGDQHPVGIPASLSGNGSELLIVNRVDVQGQQGLLVLAAKDSSGDDSLPEQLLSSVSSMAASMSELMKVQLQTNRLSNAYAELLKVLSRSIDNLNPYTTGYSEQMSRYSIIIAQQMGLPKHEIQDIALAAYLSNIGVLGLSEELYLKEGKFSEVEFEKMKLHAEVGAAIVEMTLGNKNVATYIRHHHERIDGNGYPGNLKGGAIPIGARILAVVQTFLAKTNGRKYREPLSFEKALDILRASVGTQLDTVVVEAMISWFREKQSNPKVKGRSLGACWDMCCVPKEICSTCPAFGQMDKNCWEIPGNHCQSHGKSCNSCFVRTETLSRLAGAV